MRGKKKRKIIEMMGIVVSIVCILAVFNIASIQKMLYEKDRYIPFHNVFYEDREVSLSNSGEKLLIYDGIALLLRDIKTNREDFVISLESRGVIKDFVWSEDDNYIVYLKDEFNNDFSLWLIDVAEKTNSKISSSGEYTNLSWLNSISSDNFTYAKHKIGEGKAKFYSTNLEYLTTEVINDEKKYDELAFDRKGNQILALKINDLDIEYYIPSNGEKLGSISIMDSASAGYFEVIRDKAYFVMNSNESINLYSFDGKETKLIKRSINKDLKIEKTIIVNNEFAAIYGEMSDYVWLIEDDFKERFSFIEEEEITYKLLNTSENGQLMLVRPTNRFDPGDICLVDLELGKVKEVINIRNYIKGDLLYDTEVISLEDDNRVSNFTFNAANEVYAKDDLFIMLDSDLSRVIVDNNYDPLVQSMVDRGINVAKLAYSYNSFESETISLENQSLIIIDDIENIVKYLKEEKKIDIKRIHLIAKGKSALIATEVLSNSTIDMEGLVLLEPVLDIVNSPYTSLIEKAIVNSYSDYPDIEIYTKNYDVDGANFTVYLNTEVSDSQVTNEFYKLTRKTTDNYLYKKAGVYNEHSIGSTYLLEEYFERFMDK